MPETPNHGYNTPAKGQRDWAALLNENFNLLERTTPILDTDDHITGSESIPNPPSYEPHDGALFIGTDSRTIYRGDGDEWTPFARLLAGGTNRDAFTATRDGDGETTTFTLTHELTNAPTTISVTPMSAGAAGEWWVETATVDAITVEYASPPPDGQGNLSWTVEVEG